MKLADYIKYLKKLFPNDYLKYIWFHINEVYKL